MSLLQSMSWKKAMSDVHTIVLEKRDYSAWTMSQEEVSSQSNDVLPSLSSTCGSANRLK